MKRTVRKHLTPASIPYIIGLAAAFGYLIYTEYFSDILTDDDIMTAGLVAIAVAIIGVAGGIWQEIVLLKKDGKTLNDVKSDTSEMKPEVANIDSTTKKIDGRLETLSDKIPPKDGVLELVEDLHFRKRLLDRISVNVESPDFLVAGIQNVYERNNALEKENRELRETVKMQSCTIKSLNSKIEEYKAQIQEDERGLEYE
ncbi:MAG: hypothetical protein Q4C00_07335 [Bacillota bacterium]|nr:hypothetical protein [Bacillota bacterium]